MLFTSLGFRAIWVQGGLEWTYSLSNLLLATLFAFSGISIVVAITVRPGFIIELSAGWRGRKQRNIKLIERIGWYVFGLALALFGILLFLSTLSQALSNSARGS